MFTAMISAMHIKPARKPASISRLTMPVQDSAAFALQEVIELANGCLCCSVKNDFVQALEALLQRRSKFDYILIETTGWQCQSKPAKDAHITPHSL